MTYIQNRFLTQTIFTSKDLAENEQRIISSLTPDELKIYRRMLEDPAFGQELVSSLASLEYEREPVDVRTWLEDPYYMGEVGHELYPDWREDLIEIFESKQYQQALILGGIGSGKSTWSGFAVLRQMYEASCLRDPARSYGLQSGTKLYFINLAPTAEVARRATFAGIVEKLKKSPYFMENFRPQVRNLEKFRGDEIPFPKGIVLASGSSSNNSFLGLTVMGGFIDELNFFQKTAINQRHLVGNDKFGIEGKAGELYEALKRRIKSRFLRRGRLPGLLIGASSKTDGESVTEKLVAEAFGRSDPNVFIRDRNIIELRRTEYQSKTFRVVVGNQALSSRVLTEGEEAPTNSEGTAYPVVNIPEDFRYEFESNADKALQDFRGIATNPASRFFRKPETIDACVNSKREHPFSCFYMKDRKDWDSRALYRIDWDKVCEKTERGEWKPRYFPERRRRVHMDPALTGDAYGLVIGCVSHYVEVERVSNKGAYRERLPVFHIDLILRIIGSKSEEVLMRNVRQVVYEFNEHGFAIDKITMDTYQSRENAQQLEGQGFSTEIISMDTSKEPFEELRRTIEDGRLDYYDHPWIRRELSRLVDAGQKIDHPSGGSKDLADALAGVIFSFVKDPPAFMDLAPTLGKTETIGKETIAHDSNEVRGEAATKVYAKKGPKTLKPQYVKKDDENTPSIFIG